MAKNKKKEEKSNLSPKEIRRANWENMQKNNPMKCVENDRENFRQYFTKLKRKIKLDSSLEDIMWLHFQASGFAKKEKFDDGVRHFGYKI